jgi:quercetin dioxygenase-like cupin family protein
MERSASMDESADRGSPRIVTRQLEGDRSERRRLAVELLRSLGGSPREWSNGPGDRYAEHSHDYYKVLFCLEGSIAFHSTGTTWVLEAGDRLDLPAGTPHSAVVGANGVVCVEAGFSAPADVGDMPKRA